MISLKLILFRLAAVLTLGIVPLAASAADNGLAWKREEGSVALLLDAQAVWQFNFGANASKPFFHPVALPGGPVMTWNHTPDHPWHHGLWFSWKLINGVNYWEEDPATGLSDGRTEWRNPQIETRPDCSARIAMEINYHPAPHAQSILTEQRVIEVSAPDKEGNYHQDWTMTFTAGSEEVQLDRTPPPGEPEGVSWGGYAGLSVRLASGITHVQAITTLAAEPVKFTDGCYRGAAAAMDYSGLFEGREAGFAIVDCESNLNSPSPWYAINTEPMHYFSPAVICQHPRTIKAGGQLILRYRVIVHPGRWSAEQLRQASLSVTPNIALAAATAAPAFRVLVFSKTLGYRHTNIPTGIAAIRELGEKNHFAVDATEDSGAFTAENLKRYQAVVLLSVTGDVWNAEQQEAFKQWLLGGGGLAAIHGSVFGPLACEDQWKWYGEVFCCAFKDHSSVQPGVVTLEGAKHPSTAGLPERWQRSDEWYNFDGNPRGKAQILATVDESTYQGGNMGKDHPVAWCRPVGRGRLWFTAMGHTESAFSEPFFLQHLLGGIRYAAQATSGDPSDPEPASSSRPPVPSPP